jgi:hypothetical protein
VDLDLVPKVNNRLALAPPLLILEFMLKLIQPHRRLTR